LIFESDLYKSNQGHWINYTATLLCLLDKGIITEEEYMQNRIKATHVLDEEVTRLTNKRNKEFDEKYPKAREFLKILGLYNDGI